MCYGLEAEPPDHGIKGTLREESDLVLTSADGTRFSARLARPEKPNGTGIVVMPDVRGLYGYYCALARRFAEAGVEAVAIDYFGRTAGLTDGRGEPFDHMSHLRQSSFDNISVDVTAAVGQLQGLGNVERIFTVGFCFGGAMSWRQSEAQEGLSGAIGFYGVPDRVRATIPGMKAPLLLLLAGADASTPADDFAKFQEELTTAGVQHRAVSYDGAPHSFFDRTYDQWADACRDSWRQMFDFMDLRPAAAYQ